jgi:hypothetical protein
MQWLAATHNVRPERSAKNAEATEAAYCHNGLR